MQEGLDIVMAVVASLFSIVIAPSSRFTFPAIIISCAAVSIGVLVKEFEEIDHDDRIECTNLYNRLRPDMVRQIEDFTLLTPEEWIKRQT